MNAYRVQPKPLTVRKRGKDGRNKSEREHWAFKYGTDLQYIEFIRSQKSCVSGEYGFWNKNKGVGRCEAAHWRTSATSGTSFKAPYSCIPLTPSEHKLQHQKGGEVFGDRDWWKKMVDHYLNLWVQKVKRQKGML